MKQKDIFHTIQTEFNRSARKLIRSYSRRQPWLLLFFLLIILAGSWLLSQQHQDTLEPIATIHESLEISGPYAVMRVVDGDTIVVAIDGSSETVRLIGINTPEVQTSFTELQCYGPEASAQMQRLLNAGTVLLGSDPSQDDRDIYDRLLRYVFLADGTNVAEELIRSGHGEEYTFIRAHVYQTRFKAAQTEAQDQQRGLWNPQNCPQ